MLKRTAVSFCLDGVPIKGKLMVTKRDARSLSRAVDSVREGGVGERLRAGRTPADRKTAVLERPMTYGTTSNNS